MLKTEISILICSVTTCVVLAGCRSASKIDDDTDSDTGTDSSHHSVDTAESTAATDTLPDSDVTPECAVDETRCEGTLIQQCSEGQWRDFNDCAIDGMQCGVRQGTAICYEPPQPAPDTGAETIDTNASTDDDTLFMADSATDIAASTDADGDGNIATRWCEAPLECHHDCSRYNGAIQVPGLCEGDDASDMCCDMSPGMADGDTETVVDTATDAPGNDGDTASEMSTSSGSFTFDDGLEGWDVVFSEPESDTDFTVTGGGISIAHSMADGDPDAGALAVTANVAGPNYKIQIATTVNATDLRGRVVRAKIRLAAGMTDDPGNPGGAMVFARTCDWSVWVDGGWTNIAVEDGWKELILEADYPAYIDEMDLDGDGNYAEYDAGNICEIGILVETGGSELGNGYTYQTATIYIDSVSF